MQYNSGKDYNDFGRFEECDQTPDFNYLLAYVSNDSKLPIPVSLGLCVPSVCKQADMNDLKPYLVPALNQYMSSFFADVEGYDLSQLEFSSEDIQFDDPRQLNDKYGAFKSGNAFFLTLCILYLVLTVASTVITHHRYKMRKQQAQEKRQMLKAARGTD